MFCCSIAKLCNFFGKEIKWRKTKGLVFLPWFQFAACVVFGDPLYFIPVTIFCSLLDSLHLCCTLLILVEKKVLCHTKVRYFYKFRSEGNWKKNFPVSTFLEEKILFALQWILFSLLGSCSHKRNVPACPLYYPV